MALAEVQRALASLATCEAARERLRDEPEAFARDFALACGELAQVRAIGESRILAYAESLQRKRVAEAVRLLPLSARAGGPALRRAFTRHASRVPLATGKACYVRDVLSFARATLTPSNDPVTPTPSNDHVTPTPSNGHVTPTPSNDHVTPTPSNGHVTPTLSKGHVTLSLSKGHVTLSPSKGGLTRELAELLDYETNGLRAASARAFVRVRAYAHPVPRLARALGRGEPWDGRTRRRTVVIWLALAGRPFSFSFAIG